MSKSEIIYGHHAVLSLLKHSPFQILELWCANQPQTELSELCAQYQLVIQKIDPKKLNQLCEHDKHQGIAARIKPKEMLGEAELPVLIAKDTTPLILVLDGIQDPHNFGAILRTAEAFGITCVIAPKDKSVGLTPTVRKVACGAAELVPVVQVTNLARALDTLKEAGIWCVGTEMDAPQTLSKADLQGPLALVMGAEGTGLRERTKKSCDFLVSIPMQGMVQSLNVSVSTAICLYEVRRQMDK